MNLIPFFQWVNSIKMNIQLGTNYHHKEILFLDLTIKKRELHYIQQLTGNWSNPYHRFDSSHPRSLRCNLPYDQFVRIKTNCTR